MYAIHRANAGHVHGTGVVARLPEVSGLAQYAYCDSTRSPDACGRGAQPTRSSVGDRQQMNMIGHQAPRPNAESCVDAYLRKSFR